MAKNNNPKVRHILQDGTILDDITGHKVPKDHPIYDLIARMATEKSEG